MYATKGERGTSAIAMTITELVAWRAMNNLGAMCAAAATAAPHAGQDNVKMRGEERKGKDRDAAAAAAAALKPNCRF